MNQTGKKDAAYIAHNETKLPERKVPQIVDDFDDKWHFLSFCPSSSVVAKNKGNK